MNTYVQVMVTRDADRRSAIGDRKELMDGVN
jgi:hypothetical protein